MNNMGSIHALVEPMHARIAPTAAAISTAILASSMMPGPWWAHHTLMFLPSWSNQSLIFCNVLGSFLHDRKGVNCTSKNSMAQTYRSSAKAFPSVVASLDFFLRIVNVGPSPETLAVVRNELDCL